MLPALLFSGYKHFVLCVLIKVQHLKAEKCIFSIADFPLICNPYILRSSMIQVQTHGKIIQANLTGPKLIFFKLIRILKSVILAILSYLRI